MWTDARTGVEVIDHRECLELLARSVVGRIGILEGGHPLVLPVNYAVDGEDIIIRSNEGSKVDAARNGAACFEIDDVDPDHRTGWSVVVRGRLEIVTPFDAPLRHRLADLADPWIGSRSHLLRLRSDTITGRKVSPMQAP